MLASAMRMESDAVFMDILTYQDLAILKSRQQPSKPKAPLKSSDKRYLILTYTSEFDKVHYPLPLLPKQDPTALAMKNTIAKLTRELAFYKSPR